MNGKLVQAEALLHSTEKTLTDLGEKVSAEDKEAAEKAIAELRTALESDDRDEIVSKTILREPDSSP